MYIYLTVTHYINTTVMFNTIQHLLCTEYLSIMANFYKESLWESLTTYSLIQIYFYTKQKY